MTPSREDLLRVRTVYSHSSCPDGTAAGMECAAAFASVGLAPKVRFLTYQKKEHLEMVAGPGQLFVDITPPVHRWREWAEHRPIVLDHHETAREAVVGLDGVYGEQDDSGASLAYKHVMAVLCPNEGMPRLKMMEWKLFSHYCMIRDTWKQDRSEWDEAQAIAHGLSLMGERELTEDARHGRFNAEEILRVGKRSFDKTMAKVRKMANTASVSEFGHYKIGFFNCTERLVSETGNELIAKGMDMAVGWFSTFEEGKDCLVVSLRSKAGGVAVNRVAEVFGGGGHAAAAAFRIQERDMGLERLKSLVSDALAASLRQVAEDVQDS